MVAHIPIKHTTLPCITVVSLILYRCRHHSHPITPMHTVCPHWGFHPLTFFWPGNQIIIIKASLLQVEETVWLLFLESDNYYITCLIWRWLTVIPIDAEFRKIALATAQIITISRSQVDVWTAGEKDGSNPSEQGIYQTFWVTPRWRTCRRGSRSRVNWAHHLSNHRTLQSW